MDSSPIVSVIIPFYNTEVRFMQEAINSVLRQSYRKWEIILIDDGSSRESTECARTYVDAHSNRIRYIDHPGHQNLGISATCQLGISIATGALVAFLDADDVWMENKLMEQVALMNAYPEVGALYGNTKYWYGWTGDPIDAKRDYVPDLGITSNTVWDGARLLALAIDRKVAVPCTCSIMVRKEVIQKSGGFDKRMPTMYSDQAFYTKVFLRAPVFVSDSCWDWYRQHSSSVCQIATKAGQMRTLHARFLAWLADYLTEHDVQDDDLWLAVRRQAWYYRTRPANGRLARVHDALRRPKKWFLITEEKLLPSTVRRRLWRK